MPLDLNINPPENISASWLIDFKEINITWDDVNLGSYGYEIYRSDDRSNFVLIDTVIPGVSNYIDNFNLVNDVIYQYMIRGINGSDFGNFGLSNCLEPRYIDEPYDLEGCMYFDFVVTKNKLIDPHFNGFRSIILNSNKIVCPFFPKDPVNNEFYNAENGVLGC